MSVLQISRTLKGKKFLKLFYKAASIRLTIVDDNNNIVPYKYKFGNSDLYGSAWIHWHDRIYKVSFHSGDYINFPHGTIITVPRVLTKL